MSSINEIAEFWKSESSNKNSLTQLQRYEKKNAPEEIKKFISIGGGAKMGTTLERYARFRFKNLKKREKGEGNTGHDQILKLDTKNILVEQKSSGHWEAVDYKFKYDKKVNDLVNKRNKFSELLAKKPNPEKWNKGDLTVAIVYKGLKIASKCAKDTKEQLAAFWVENGNMNLDGGEIVLGGEEGEEGEEGEYKWQHIEAKHHWNMLLLCGIDYTDVKFWGMDRKTFDRLVLEDKITIQGDKGGNSSQGMWTSYSTIKDSLVEIKSNEQLIQFASSLQTSE